MKNETFVSTYMWVCEKAVNTPQPTIELANQMPTWDPQFVHSAPQLELLQFPPINGILYLNYMNPIYPHPIKGGTVPPRYHSAGGLHHIRRSLPGSVRKAAICEPCEDLYFEMQLCCTPVSPLLM